MRYKGHVYFHIDERSRDAVVASALKLRLADVGFKLHYGNRRSSVDFARGKFPFDVGIFPSLDMLFKQFGDSSRVDFPAIILPTESIHLSDKTHDRLTQHLLGAAPEILANPDPWLNKVALFCLWGANNVDVIRARRPEIGERSLVVGHPRHDSYCLISAKEKRRSRPLRIGLISRADGVNSFDGMSNILRVDGLRKQLFGPLSYYQSDNYDVEDMWYCSVFDLKWILNIIEICKQNEFEVSLRPHPREDRSRWEEFRTETGGSFELSDWRIPFCHWASEQDVLISSPSTSLYDCAMLGKPVVLTNGLQPRRRELADPKSDDFDPILEFFPSPTSVDEFLKELEALQLKAGSTSTFSGTLAALLRDETNFPQCETALKSVAAAAANLAVPSRGSCLKFVGGWRRGHWYVRQWFRVKTHLLRYALNRKHIQSSTFILTRRDRRSIDALANRS